MGLFRGEVGDNAVHAHGAHQLSVGLTGVVDVEAAGRHVCGRGVFVPAACPHRIEGGSVLSLYADPSSDLGMALHVAFAPDARATTIDDRIAQRLADIGASARQLTAEVVYQVATVVAAPDDRCKSDDPTAFVVRALVDAIRSGSTPSRAELAALIGLSEGRFSHWFRERTGMPMQTFRKWQRLTLAVEYILGGEAMASAAVHAGFADQAHFVRTFRAMFGVVPAAALRAKGVG